jgi:hypothetical protein
VKDPKGPRQLELDLPAQPEAAPKATPREKIRRGLMAAAGGPTQEKPAAKAPKAAAAPPAASASDRPRLRVIQGGGQREREKLGSRDAVVRVLLEAGADLLLRKISSVRAEEIESQVEAILDLFDRVDREPNKMAELQRRLDDLEALMTETRARKPAR